MKPKFAYWSVATGDSALELEQCVESARHCGVSEDFVALSDRVIAGAHSYQAHGGDAVRGLHLMIYLKAALAKLSYDYFVFVDSATRFYRQPDDLVSLLSRSPIHTPLIELDLLAPSTNGGFSALWKDRMRRYGVGSPEYYSYPLFWIVHHDVIDRLYDLSGNFMSHLDDEGDSWNMDAALTYGMLMLCASPRKHTWRAVQSHWSSDAIDLLAADGDGNPEDVLRSSMRHVGGPVSQWPYFSGSHRETAIPVDPIYRWEALAG